MSQRIDLVQLDLAKPKKLDNGWLKVDARLTRTGVFTYSMPDGSVRRELRLPEEVFSRDALDSFTLVPVTDEHPPVFLDATNSREYTRGVAGGTPTRDGEFVRGGFLIYDASLISKLESGEAREVSCGYLCDVEDVPGVTTHGERYDGIQRNIRGNHVAIVPKGRAGPGASVRMDGVGCAVMRTEASVSGTNSISREPTMMKMKIDGVDYEASEGASQAYSRVQQKHSDEVGGLQGKLDALQAKVDSLEIEVKKKDAEIAELPAKVLEQAKARADLEHKASNILGKKVKLDSLGDVEIHKLVAAKVKPEVKLDDKSDAYVAALFDISVLEVAKQDSAEKNGLQVAARRLVGKADNAEEGDSEETEPTETEGEKKDALTPFERMRRDSQSAWLKTAKRHGLEVG